MSMRFWYEVIKSFRKSLNPAKNLLILLPEGTPPPPPPEDSPLPHQIFISSYQRLIRSTKKTISCYNPINALFFSCSQCTIFALISYSFYIRVMLILILIDVQYSQKAVFSFEKGLSGQNYSSSGSHHLEKNPPSKISTPPTTHTLYCYLENPALISFWIIVLIWVFQYFSQVYHQWKYQSTYMGGGIQLFSTLFELEISVQLFLWRFCNI